jgi:hypothetical protein
MLIGFSKLLSFDGEFSKTSQCLLFRIRDHLYATAANFLFGWYLHTNIFFNLICAFDIDQVPFGVAREFNFRHEAAPSAMLLHGRPVTLPQLIVR